MEPIGNAVFINENGYIFRTEACLKWGKSSETLGTIIMLNPGESELSDKKK